MAEAEIRKPIDYLISGLLSFFKERWLFVAAKVELKC